MIFYVAEIDNYRPGGTIATPQAGPIGTTPNGALTQFASPLESFDTIRVSDLGYRSRTTDAGGLQVYPPYLDAAFAIDRQINLSPNDSATAAAWGSLKLSNAENTWDSIAATNNSDGRGVRIYYGEKIYDDTRGIYLDPPFASLKTLFIGIAQPWFLSDQSLDIPLRDATYWLERPVQTALYGGTGGLDGTAELLGLPKPKTRGSVRSITPVLVDSINRIYQWTDNAGTIIALYEGGATGITFGSDVADLYVGSTTAGQYRTNKARGLFQLGSVPTRQITIDATGDFITPAAGSVTTAVMLARWFLTDDLALPASLIDVASFTTANTFVPYAAGFYIGPEVVDGAKIVGDILASVAAKLVPSRIGTLEVYLLRQTPAYATPLGTYGREDAVSVKPRALPATLDPPPYRWQVAHSRAWTVATSDLSPLITTTQKQYIAVANRYSIWISTTVLAAYRRPNDPPPLQTFLQLNTFATLIANALGALFGQRVRLYDVVLPVSMGITRDIGDFVRVIWPMDDLGGGKIGQIVGDQFRSSDSTLTLTVLI